jgi:SNF2 family DNA or RNA helicase
MGLGKTVSTLTAIVDLINFFEVSKVLIVAPKRVAEMTWGDEVENWQHLNGLRVSVIKGTAKQREAAARADADIYTVSRDNLVWLLQMWGGSKVPYDMIVLDELSSFKNHQSKRFKAAKIIRRSCNRVVGLTGTPAPNGLIDLWAQMYLVDGGVRLGKTITDYRANYFRPGAQNGGIIYEYKPLPTTENVLSEKIADITLSMKALDFLDMPELTYINNYVELSPKVKKQYDKFEEDQVLQLMQEEEITALSAAALSNKLLQFAGGAIYDADRQVHGVHNEKLETLVEMIEAANGSPVLVAYNFQHEKDRILDALKDYGAEALEGVDSVRRWNNGEIPVLVTHPASAGHGLNMQKGGNRIIWFGVTWSLELYQQFNARLWRQGQRSGVFVHHIVARGTIDEKVIAALSGKAATQDGLMSAVKDLIKKYSV